MYSTKYLKLFSVILGVKVVVIVVALIYLYNQKHEPVGAVVTNGLGCASIGSSIMKKGGSAVDAAIAALFCEGVTLPQSMGLGGGFLMTIYSKAQGRVVVLNARERAAAAASRDMFNGNSTVAIQGGLSIAVPGELRGYWWAYKRFGGKVSWREIVQPTIDLCRKGIRVSPYLANVLKSMEATIRADPGLRDIYIDPQTNQTYKESEYVKRMNLAQTLEVIATEGGDAMHNGSLTKTLVEDIQNNGGIITEDDLRNYRPKWLEPIKVDLPFGDQLYTAPLPGSGVILAFILNILKGEGFLDYSNIKSMKNWQRIIESLKYGYGKRTELGDPNFVDIKELLQHLTSSDYAKHIRESITDDKTFQDPEHYGANTTIPEDHGTAHLSFVAPNGDAVAVTSTINLYFGSRFMSTRTGIILNDEMDDFSSPNITNEFGIPPSVANYIVPDKTPLSSMCPSIILDKNNNTKMVVGSAGGSKITTSVALVIIKHLWFNMTLRDAVYDKRLHHQLFPMKVQLENSYKNETEFLEGLERIGHKYKIADDNGFSALTAISLKDPKAIQCTSDKRRPGEEVVVD